MDVYDRLPGARVAVSGRDEQPAGTERTRRAAPHGGATSDDVRAATLLDVFDRGRDLTRQLLEENQILREELAALAGHDTERSEDLERCRAQVSMLEARCNELQQHNDSLTENYKATAEQNGNLANLYVAGYQLHSTLDIREVIEILQEIIVNLIGADAYALLLLDEETGQMRPMVYNGDVPDLTNFSAESAEILRNAAVTGESYFAPERMNSRTASQEPLVAVPLRLQDKTLGLILVYRLLQQKDSLTATDYELFSLLAGHAATAIFAAQLYSSSERRLNTIQSFLNLLTND